MIVLALLLTGCGPADTLPADWDLAAEGIRVRVARDPYRFEVRDLAGRIVLSSLGEGSGDGYGTLGWTSGAVEWGTVVSPGWTSFDPDLDPWRDGWRVVEATSEGGPGDASLVLVLEPPGGADAGLAVTVTHRVDAGRLRVEATLDGATPRAWSAAFATPPDEAFLGFGERFNRTDQRGVEVFSWAEEGGIGTGEGEIAGPDNPYPNGEAMTYYPVPFFLSTEGYGFWLDTAWRSSFDLATDRDDAWRAWHVGPDLAFEVYLPRPGDSRPWPYQAIDAFTARTGRPMVPPDWAFGPRRRIGSGDVQDGVPEIQAMRDRDLALTGVDDATHFLPRGSHVGNEDRLAAWTASGAALGARMCAYFNPYLEDAKDNPLAAYVEEGKENGFFLKDADGSWSDVWLVSGSLVTVLSVDFTDPDAVAWYQSMYTWALDLGYSCWMQDFGEYVQPSVLTASGEGGEAHHNRYPVVYHQAVHDGLEASAHAGDWLGFVRSGYTGASAYAPMVWSGDPAASFEDADGLPSMVRAGVNLGLSGAPFFGGDIGGFHCVSDGWEAADGELLARWIQQGALTPNMQDQDACNGAVGDGEKASIWTSPDAEAAWATYARLHTRLFPYLYTLALDAGATGAPLMRQPFLEHPLRPDLAAVDDAYYLGPALWVAPVLERGARARTVVLPEGLYLDWTDTVLHEGGGEVTVDAPLDKLPLFLRDGHLVPLLDPTIDTLAGEDHPDVVGPDDVADVYDVVGLVSTRTGAAAFAPWDGGDLAVVWEGGFQAPDLPEAADADALATCDTCFLVEDLGGGLLRVRISADGVVEAGGLGLVDTSPRRVRWDLYLVE